MSATTPPWSQQALAGLREAGFRSGGARRAVVEHLGQQTCCRSVQELHDGIRGDGGKVGIASVYRVMDTLLALRLVQRVDIGDGIARFEPAGADGDHHHHLVCDDCGLVQPFHDDGLEDELGRLARRLDYAMAQHEVILHGTCADCR